MGYHMPFCDKKTGFTERSTLHTYESQSGTRPKTESERAPHTVRRTEDTSLNHEQPAEEYAANGRRDDLAMERRLLKAHTPPERLVTGMLRSRWTQAQT